jgi:hypothetical protein
LSTSSSRAGGQHRKGGQSAYESREHAASGHVTLDATRWRFGSDGFGPWERQPGRSLKEEELGRIESLAEMGREAKLVPAEELDTGVTSERR